MGDTISKRLIERLRGDEGVEPRITRQMVRTQLERAGALRAKLQAYLQAGVDDKKRSIALHLQSSRAESTAAALRAQADLIYNRYYTQGGICDMLQRFEDFVYEEMEDLTDERQIKNEIQANHVRVLLYGFERLNQALQALGTQQERLQEHMGVLTEEMLIPLGWRPIGVRMEAVHKQLMALYTDAQAMEACSLQSWSMMTVSIEECAGLFARSRKSVTTALDVPQRHAQDTQRFAREEALYQALKDLFLQEPFCTLKDPQANEAVFAQLAEDFVVKARNMVIEPFDRD